MKKKVLVIFGTRPEAIKMAPLIRTLYKQENIFDTKICITAQHREMLDQVLSLFEIMPEYDLNIMKPGQDLYDISSNVLLGLRNILKQEKPDIVLVHGDTTTSSMAALSAFYQQISVGHIEAGLRTNNIYSPWPEEINRQITGRIANFHFSPTRLSKENLLNENINKENIFTTGNTVIDALYWALDKMKNTPALQEIVNKRLIQAGLNHDWNILNEKIILVTGHRRENQGKGFENICKALEEIALNRKNTRIIYPVHLSPSVRDTVFPRLKNISNINLLEPLDYLPFVYLMQKCHIILTDSGGIQEEAPSLGKPVLVMRDTTERPEALDAGTVKLVGTDSQLIFNNVNELIDNESNYQLMAKAINPYGDGKACERICDILARKL